MVAGFYGMIPGPSTSRPFTTWPLRFGASPGAPFRTEPGKTEPSVSNKKRPSLVGTACSDSRRPICLPLNMLDKSFRLPRTLLWVWWAGQAPNEACPAMRVVSGNCSGNGRSCAAGSWARPGRPRTAAIRRTAGAPAPARAADGSRPAPGRPRPPSLS